MKFSNKILFPIMIPILIGCTSPSPDSKLNNGQSITQRTSQRINGLRRTYRLHIPTTYSPQKHYPLVVALHGAFSGAKQMEKETGLSHWADREEVIVAYPNGMSLFGFLRHWNAGHCCGKAANDQLDDVGFIAAVIQKTATEWPIDPTRIYVVGFSNGGMMAHRFASEKSELIAAAACVAGAIGGRPTPNQPFWKIAQPEVPVPMLIIHSRTDTHVPYLGGTSPKNQKDPREYLSVEDAIQIWKNYNHCNKEPTTKTFNHGLIQHTTWPSNNSTPVELYTLDDWPHQWPGPYFNNLPEAKEKLGHFNATEAIGAFFLQHRQTPHPTTH